jgi:hypothetical protein
MTDGFSTKTVWSLNTAAASQISQEFDLVIAIGVGITLSAIAAVSTNMVGSFRQIADAQGQLVNPVGLPL